MGMSDLIDSFIKKLSQNLPSNYTDPNAIQQGQSVYNNLGEEYIVIEDDPTTTYKTLMPAEEKGSTVPQNVETVEDYELSTNYTVQEQDPNNPDPNVNASKKSSLELIKNTEINSFENSLISQQIHKLSQDLDYGFNTPSLDSSRDFPTFLENPKSGYTKIKSLVQSMLKQGYSDTDILLLVGETFDRDLAARVLSDLKTKGLF